MLRYFQSRYFAGKANHITVLNMFSSLPNSYIKARLLEILASYASYDPP